MSGLHPSTTLLYISARRGYRSGMSLEELRDAVREGWSITLSKARSAEVAVAFVGDTVVGAWRLLDAYQSGKVFDGRKLVNLSLGSALPVAPEWVSIPRIRRGVGVLCTDGVD